MAGRGRGRGRGGGGALKELSAATQEADASYEWHTATASQPPLLFPPAPTPKPVQLSPDDCFEIQKLRDIRHHMLHMAHRLSFGARTKDIVRYSDKYNVKQSDVTSVWGSMTKMAPHAQALFPSELVENREAGRRDAARKKGGAVQGAPQLVAKWYNKKFSQLEERERRLASREGEPAKPPEPEKQDGLDSDGEHADEFDADLDADYTMDHYASDDDGMYDDGDGGGQQYE